MRILGVKMRCSPNLGLITLGESHCSDKQNLDEVMRERDFLVFPNKSIAQLRLFFYFNKVCELSPV